MPPQKSDCGCGFGRKSAFGNSADFFFNNLHDPAKCLMGRNNFAQLTHSSGFGKSSYGPMKIGKKK